MRKIAATMHQNHHMSMRFLKDAEKEASPVLDTLESKRPSPQATRRDTTAFGSPREQKPSSPLPSENGNQSAGQKIVNAMGALLQLGFAAPKKSNVAFFAGYVENWRFDGRIADLREQGLVEVVGPGEIALTAEGRTMSDASQSIRTLNELHRTWLEKLPAAESSVLRRLLYYHPHPRHREHLATDLDRQDNWRFAAVLNQLKALGIAEFNGSGDVALTDALFPEGLE